MLTRILIVLAILPGLPTAAQAEPISLAITAVTAFLGTSVGIGTLTVGGLLQLGLFAAGIATSFIGQGGRRQQQIDPGQARGTFKGDDSAEIRCVGRVRIGGVKAFGNTQDFRRARLILHSKGPIDGVEQHYLGGREIIVEADGTVASPPYVRPGGSYVYVKAKAGDGSETAWPDLMALFPTLWTAEHRVRGIAQSLLLYDSPGLGEEKFLQLYQNGAPDYERIQRGELIYDPRDGVTRWSDNGVLCVLHIMLTFPSLTLSDFDLPFLAAEADRADALVTTRTGTEPRSRCWGVWNSEIERGSLLEQVLLSVGAEIVSRPGGLYGIALIDDERASEVTIPVRHIGDISWKSGPESVERPNLCAVKYYSPERNYELYEIDLTGTSWHRIESEIALVGEQKVEYSLPFCPSAAQAQRIARRAFAVARGDTGMVTTNFVGMAAWGARGVTIELPDLDLSPICAATPARVNDDDGTVEIGYTIWPTLAPWNPATDEALPPPQIPDLGYQSNLPTPNAPSATTVVTYPDASKASRIAYEIVGGVGITQTEASYRVLTAGVPGPWTSMIEDLPPNGYATAFTTTDLTGLSVQFRVRYFNADEDGSLWSPLLVATPAVSNTVPAIPLISVVQSGIDPSVATISVVAPNSLNVSYLETTGEGSPGETAIRPGQPLTWSFNLPAPTETDQVFTWTAQAFSTNGTGGPTASVSVTVTGNPT